MKNYYKNIVKFGRKSETSSKNNLTVYIENYRKTKLKSYNEKITTNFYNKL